MKPSDSRLCSSVHLSQIVVWYTATGLYITLHSSSARVHGIFPVQIHLIGIRDSPDHRSVRNKEVKFIWLYSLLSRFSVRCPYYWDRVRIIEVLFKKIYENFVGTLQTVRNREVSVLERHPYQEVRLYTLFSGTYPYRPNKGVPPPTPTPLTGMYASCWNLRRGRAHRECSGEFQLSVKQQKESKILMFLPILRWITSKRPLMFALPSLGTFFLFCSIESVLFWKCEKRDTSGETLCHVSNSNVVVSRHVEIFLPFVVIFKSVKLINFHL